MDKTIAVIGLGYVGLPLAVEFGKKYRTIGFDINPGRIAELEAGRDHTLEVSPDELAEADRLSFSSDPADLEQAERYIVTVPTPLDRHQMPDLGPLLAASRTVGRALSSGDIVIYESTVYPGATEEECVPVLEAESGLAFNRDFFCGYSPERINPGDKKHRLATIPKVTSGSTPEAARTVDELYRSIITAGTHPAPSIKVAEAAKVIENSQRDINIAFVNELAVIFGRLGIDTKAVLQAAGTKWNFLPFSPGLVGGHCIGIDPYYLAQKAKETGYEPAIILAGRKLNDGMGVYVASRVVKLMIGKGHRVGSARALVLGITFKENCPDIRNTRVVDVVSELESFGVKVDVYDPWADPEEVKREYGIDLLPGLPSARAEESAAGAGYDAIVAAVSHREFAELDLAALKNGGRPETVVFDIKRILDPDFVDEAL
ncbi:MAG: nucleotide sugar dehydrogenase [Spirochaetales bacterium]|nr:nucleotide sugar dehydrogenase [Spirochaetales bacterium]MCF7937759.1 nucleotide sugar dehydrogenase [Spirochaetales bacterium]